MPVRRAAPSSKPSPKPSGYAESEPTREALLAALAERERELAEAQEQQAATAEILRVISQSPTDARPVFESIVVTAARLLRCDMAFVLLREGDAYVHTAGATPEGPMPDLAPERIPIDPNANFPSRAFLARTMLHLPDWSQIELPEHERRIHEMFGVNSVLYLPLLRDDECIGLLAVGGRRANIFGPSEIAQAESFRDQALIAMENARLFNETQEALERQTATAEVLKVIASSPSDVQPVFEAIATSANRLLGGFSTTVIRFVGDALHLVAFTPTNAVGGRGLAGRLPKADRRFPAVRPGSRRRDPAVHRHRGGIGRAAGHQGTGATARLSQHAVHAADEQGRRHRHDQRHPQGAGRFRPGRREAAAHLRRSGRHRDPECAALQRDAGGAGAADGLGRNPAGDRQFADRRAASVRRHRAQRRRAMRGDQRHRVSIAGRPHRSRGTLQLVPEATGFPATIVSCAA